MQPSGRHDLGFAELVLPCWGLPPSSKRRHIIERTTEGRARAKAKEILVNAYAFTIGSGIPGALVRAHDRGVAVAVIADKWTPSEQKEERSPVAAAGIPVWIDARARIA